MQLNELQLNLIEFSYFIIILKSIIQSQLLILILLLLANLIFLFDKFNLIYLEFVFDNYFDFKLLVTFHRNFLRLD